MAFVFVCRQFTSNYQVFSGGVIVSFGGIESDYFRERVMDLIINAKLSIAQKFLITVIRKIIL
jgi:hypothetical protein